MNKVGILTFHASHNYGSVLQAYALQNTVNTCCKCDCEIINFVTDRQKDMYSIFYNINSLKDILRNVRVRLYKYKIRKDRFEDFNKFIYGNLKLSEKVYRTKEELESDINKYNTIICGSDQVWNLTIKDFDYSYFAPFKGDFKKVSYAPSCGGDEIFNRILSDEQVKEYINDFDSLSVRENVAQNMLKKITDKDISIVLDPTLLVPKEKWDEICSDRIIKEDYIFLYSIDYNDDVVRMAKNISKRLNLPVYILFNTPSAYKKSLMSFKFAKSESPEDFISLVKNAKLVLSNSFHGTVFSIIYRKAFYVLRGTYDGKINTDDRISTLLGKFKLKDREININNLNEKSISCDVDYSENEKYINLEREKSIEYLRNSIVR
ncbi:MAG: polysaccharide pyruvyl transferase family protein [Clostridium sp.]|nr:polysaccharide pyruvyl transferase family protein [Clostridium sp.]